MKNCRVTPFSGINRFMVLPFFSPLRLDFWTAGPEETENPAGRKALRLIQIRLATSSLAKIRLASQDNSAQRGSPDSALPAQCHPIVMMSAAKVTAALPLRVNAETQTVVYCRHEHRNY